MRGADDVGVNTSRCCIGKRGAQERANVTADSSAIQGSAIEMRPSRDTTQRIRADRVLCNGEFILHDGLGCCPRLLAFEVEEESRQTCRTRTGTRRRRTL